MWKKLLSTLHPECEFHPPASSDEIYKIEQKLQAPFPDELKSALRESDGVEGEYGLGLLWPLERILQDNLSFRSNRDFRSLYMPFDPLLFFGDAGNGDQFAFTVLAGEVRRSDIFVWNHEDDSRSWVAPSLGVFFEWWLTGRLKI